MARAWLVALAMAAATAAATAASAAEGGVTGIWTRDDGAAKIRFSACGGGAVCGFLAWKRDPGGAGKVGDEIFFDMRPSGENAWAGSAFNPQDGRRYSGKMTLSGDRLVTAGCVLGGLICKSFDWTRAK